MSTTGLGRNRDTGILHVLAGTGTGRREEGNGRPDQEAGGTQSSAAQRRPQADAQRSGEGVPVPCGGKRGCWGGEAAQGGRAAAVSQECCPCSSCQGPSLGSSGREHSFEQNWDVWVAKSTSAPAQAGHWDLPCSVKGSDTASQPTETPPRGSRSGAKGLARPPSRPTDTLLLSAAGDSPGRCVPGELQRDRMATPPTHALCPTQAGAAGPAQAAIRGVLLPCPSAPGHKAALGEDTEGAAMLLWSLCRCGAMLLTPSGRVASRHSGQGCDSLHTPGTGQSCPTPAHTSQDSGWTGGSSARTGGSISRPAQRARRAVPSRSPGSGAAAPAPQAGQRRRCPAPRQAQDGEQGSTCRAHTSHAPFRIRRVLFHPRSPVPVPPVCPTALPLSGSRPCSPAAEVPLDGPVRGLTRGGGRGAPRVHGRDQGLVLPLERGRPGPQLRSPLPSP